MTQASHWNEENYRHYIAAFQHYTKMVSKQVDSVLKALYSTPAGRNTIVVIMADHGDGMASHRMVTKHISFYDEMTNVPFIFAGPGIKQQKKPIKQVLTQPTLDLLPTLCDLAGISCSGRKKPGISLAPTLKGEEQKKTRPYVVSEWHSEYEYVVTPGRMVRGPKYKYTHYLEGNGEELYDMKKDPGERKNLAKDPKYSKVLAEHRAMLDDYITRTKDDYRSLKVDADPRCRNTTRALGYERYSKENKYKKSEDFFVIFTLFSSFAGKLTSKQFLYQVKKHRRHIIAIVVTALISVTLYAARTNSDRLSLLQPLLEYNHPFSRTPLSTASLPGKNF